MRRYAASKKKDCSIKKEGLQHQKRRTVKIFHISTYVIYNIALLVREMMFCTTTQSNQTYIHKFWLSHDDHCCGLTKLMYNNSAETHLGGGVKSTFSSHWQPLLSCDWQYVKSCNMCLVHMLATYLQAVCMGTRL